MIISRVANGKCTEEWGIFDRLSIAERGTKGWIKKKALSSIMKEEKKRSHFWLYPHEFLLWINIHPYVCAVASKKGTFSAIRS